MLGLCGKELVAFDVIPLTEINDRAAESAEQDQTDMCRLILPHFLFKRIHGHKWQDKG